VINWVRRAIKSYQATNRVPYIIAVWIPLHIIAILGLTITVLLQKWEYLIFFIPGWAVFGGLGSAIILHRYTAHRSIVIRRRLKPLLLWIACMSAQGSPIWWAALHRGYHHAHSDQEKDPHSPNKGFWYSYMGWMFAIQAENVSLRHSIELLKDSTFLWFHRHYNRVIWSSMLALGLVDPLLCVWFYVIPALVALHSDSIVNSWCHTQGSGNRRYATKDQSENVWYLGVFGWGQGWHNNHHSDPRSYDFGTSISGLKREIDPCLLWVPLISPWDETKRIFSRWRASWVG
jgi:fatty-acid desaturase